MPYLDWKITYYPWVKLLDPTAKTDSILKIDPFLYQNQSYYYYINYYINLTNYIQHIVRTIKYVQLLSMINIFQWCCLKKYRSKKTYRNFSVLAKKPSQNSKKSIKIMIKFIKKTRFLTRVGFKFLCSVVILKNGRLEGF